MTQSTPSAIVVGAGVVGLCTAWSLARRGAAVTVVERGSVPDPRAASCDHHRMIRLSYADPGYCARMTEAYAAWEALWADLPGPPTRYYHERGVLTLSREPGDWGDRARAAMEAVGQPFERLEPGALAERFAHLEPSNEGYGFLSRGGCLMANHILVDLAERLRGQGAAILEQSPATAIDAEAGEVSLADGRRLSADVVVLAGGVGAQALAPDLLPELWARRTVILYADPPADLAEAWASAPCWTDLGGEEDLWGLPPVDGLPLKLGCAILGRDRPDPEDRTMRPEEIRRMLEVYRGRFRGIDRFQVRWGQANHFTCAPGDRFVLKRRDRLWAVSADSGHGFKFGALSGEDVAAAALGEVPEAEAARRMAALPA
ncbi:MAG: NAD(P)/FAD-dependent oxidoreductase [Albimonas sp.]|uniref:NAD(P)/FAD-dependent oxidoreductase n=1 Tax=Albimonas sp. TaxID=1872425 RepID=UPI004056FCFB|tara:strand:- start:43 stop:1164 length:1122 start_codon:yes stop_codon:yes gene_type:complete